MDPQKLVVVAVIDTKYNLDSTPYTRINRGIKFVESIIFQKRAPDYLILCPTYKQEQWNDLLPLIKRKMTECSTTLLIGTEMAKNSDLATIQSSLSILEDDIGEEEFEQCWISILLYPKALHPSFCQVVCEAVDSKAGSMTQAMVFKRLGECDLGFIHESIFSGKIIKAFFQTHMFRSLSSQSSPYWTLTILMWARMPLFPNSGHTQEVWNEQEDIYLLQQYDEVMYEGEKVEIQKIEKTEAEIVFHVKSPYAKQTDKSFPLTRVEFSVVYDSRSCTRLEELEVRTQKFMMKKHCQGLTTSIARGLLYRTETALQASLAMGSLCGCLCPYCFLNMIFAHPIQTPGKQQEIAILFMEKHITEHSTRLTPDTIQKLAVWAQNDGPVVASELLNLPVPEVADFLDNPEVPVSKDLLIDSKEGDTLRPLVMKDVIMNVTKALSREIWEDLGTMKRIVECIRVYAVVFCMSIGIKPPH